MKYNMLLFKRIAAMLLFVVLSMWAGLDLCAQQRIKFIYDNAGNRLTRQKEIVVQTRGTLSDEDSASTYEERFMESKVTIYPNPTRGMLKVDISGVETFDDAGIALYDITGKQLQQWTGITPSNTLDISECSPGIYIIQIAYNGNVSSWKIIKE